MRIVPILALAVLAACQSTPASKTPANLEELIHHCQAQTGSNFTYSAETGALLRARGLKLAASDPHTAQAWFDVLRGVLEGQELELLRVGPEHLGVWLVRPVAKSG